MLSTKTCAKVYFTYLDCNTRYALHGLHTSYDSTVMPLIFQVCVERLFLEILDMNEKLSSSTHALDNIFS